MNFDPKMKIVVDGFIVRDWKGRVLFMEMLWIETSSPFKIEAKSLLLVVNGCLAELNGIKLVQKWDHMELM